jgi:uncharacterized protein YdhG (YjbR/CyaY superfamily)
MKTDRPAYLSVDEYIASFPEHTQHQLEEIRNAIKELAPGAQEKISYQMPAFFLNRILVYFAGYAKHIGLYPGAAAIEIFKDELSGYKTSKGTIQFPLGEPLPIELIKRIVQFRIEENNKLHKK